MTNFDIYKEYIKDNVVNIYINKEKYYFCSEVSCQDCTIRKLCIDNRRDPKIFRPILTQKEIEIAQEENPEYFL